MTTTTGTPHAGTPHAGASMPLHHSLDHSLGNHETFFGSATKRTPTPTSSSMGGEDRDYGFTNGQGLGRSQIHGEKDRSAKAELMQSIAQHSLPGPQLVLWLDEEIR